LGSLGIIRGSFNIAMSYPGSPTSMMGGIFIISLIISTKDDFILKISLNENNQDILDSLRHK